MVSLRRAKGCPWVARDGHMGSDGESWGIPRGPTDAHGKPNVNHSGEVESRVVKEWFWGAHGESTARQEPPRTPRAAQVRLGAHVGRREPREARCSL